MKVLKLQINKESFDKILSGEQKVETRMVWPTNAHFYIYYTQDGKMYKRDKDIPDLDKPFDFHVIKYDALYLINGRRKDARRLTIEVKDTEIVAFTDEEGNVQTYEENGQSYIVSEMHYHLGNVISTENV